MFKNIISLPIAILSNALISLILAFVMSLTQTIFLKIMLVKPHFLNNDFSIFFPFFIGLIAGNEVLKKINPKLIKSLQIIYFIVFILYYIVGLFYSFLDYLFLIIISIGFIYKIQKG